MTVAAAAPAGLAALAAGRAAPGAAAAAATAAALATAASAAAWVGPIGRHRNPFAAKALAPGAAAVAPQQQRSGVCPLGYGVGQDPKALYKTYPFVDLPTVLSTLAPKNVLWVYVKNQALVAVLNFNTYLYEVLEAEEAAMQSGVAPHLPPFPDMGPMVDRAVTSSLRELLTTLVRRIYEHAWRAKASSRWAWKVLKSWRDSVTRKALWYTEAGPLTLVPRYARTVTRGTALFYLADWTVSTGYSAYQIFRVPAAAAPRLQKRLQLLSRLATQHAARCAITWVAAGVGAALVAAVAPRERAGRWAGYGHLLCDVVVSNGVVYFLLEGSPVVIAPAEGGAAAAAGPGGGGGGGGGGVVLPHAAAADAGAAGDGGGAGADWAPDLQ